MIAVKDAQRGFVHTPRRVADAASAHSSLPFFTFDWSNQKVSRSTRANLKQKLQRQLHDAWAYIGLNLSEAGRTDVADRETEIGVVEEIE